MVLQLLYESLNLLKHPQGTVCLPVHDAIAVQRQHAEWAKEVMLETWSRHMDGVKTVVKVDMAAPSVGS